MRKLVLLAMVAMAVFAATYVKDASDLGYTISADINLSLDARNDFTQLAIDAQWDFSTAFAGTVGGPALPVIRKIVRIPEGDGFDISADFEREEIDLVKKGLSTVLYPQQSPRFKSGKPSDFEYSPDLYHGQFGRKVAEIKPIGHVRGKRIGLLTIYPVAYDVAKGVLEFRSHIDLRIAFSQPIEPVDSRLASRVFNRMTVDILEPADIDPIPSPEACYLIVTHEDFADSLLGFKKALATWGYRVRMVTTEETGEDVDNIQDYIQTAYDDWVVPPSFVLFVGSFDHVTSTVIPGSGWWDPGHPTDLYYVTTDGSDYIPDIIHGRMAVEDLEDLHFLLAKTLSFYEWDFTEPSIWKRIAFAACGDDGLYEVAMGTHQYAMDEYFHMPDYEPDSVWALEGGDTDDVLSILNNNVFLFNYSGHCSEDGWSNPTLEISDLSLVTNTHPALLIGNCCLSGKFDDECFAARVTNRHNGAVVYLGASNSTMWDEDDVWERRMYDAIMDGEYHHVGSFMFRGNMAVLEEYPDEAEYYFEIYHNFGDPALVF